MDSFKELVEDAFKNQESFLIYNSSKDHAKILILNLIKHAQKEIKIYTSGNDVPFYDDQEIKTILKKNEKVDLQVILDNKNSANRYKDIFPNKTTFYNIKPGKQIKEISLPPMQDEKFLKIKHFTIIDNISFRVEAPHSEQTISVDAVACANNEKTSSYLNDVFGLLKNDFCEALQ